MCCPLTGCNSNCVTVNHPFDLLMKSNLDSSWVYVFNYVIITVILKIKILHNMRSSDWSLPAVDFKSFYLNISLIEKTYLQFFSRCLLLSKSHQNTHN